MLQRPHASEHSEYFGRYVNQVPDGDLIALLKTQQSEFVEEIRGASNEQMDYRYADGKWTLRQVLIHINDVERIFGYRALCCMRSDSSSIPGFEQDDYADITQDSTRSLENLIEEFQAIRASNIHLFASATDEEWIRTANVSNGKISARALAYLIFGHVEHHRKLNRLHYLG